MPKDEWDVINGAKTTIEAIHFDDPQGPVSDVLAGFDTERLDSMAFYLHATGTMIDQEISRRASAIPVDRS